MLGGLGAVLDQGACVHIEGLPGGPDVVVGQAPGELCPTTLEQGETGLGGEVPGKGQAEAEAPGVIGPGGLVGVEELLEVLPALGRDPVDLAGALGAPCGAGPAGPQPRTIAAE